MADTTRKVTDVLRGAVVPQGAITADLGALYIYQPTPTTANVYQKVSQAAPGVPDNVGWEELVPVTLVANFSMGSLELGTGEDGDLVLDGVNPILGIAPVAGVYTFTGYCTQARNVHIDAGVRWNYRGAPLLIRGTLSGAGTISFNGNHSTGRPGGAAVAASQLAGSAGGGEGGLNGTGGAAAGTSGNAHVYFPTSGASNGGAFPGGVGGAGTVGRGGGGGAGFGNAATGGAVTQTGGAGDIRNPDSWKSGRIMARTVIYTSGSGGGGGSGGGTGGGGGAGGGWIFVATYRSTFTGVIEAKGGNGGPGVAAGTNASGGGGGGGGGTLYCAVGAGVLPNVDVSGGIGGLGQNGSGGQVGAAGGVGGVGVSNVFRLSQ